MERFVYLIGWMVLGRRSKCLRGRDLFVQGFSVKSALAATAEGCKVGTYGFPKAALLSSNLDREIRCYENWIKA